MSNKAGTHSLLLLKKNKMGGISLLLFSIYYVAIVTKTVWYWQRDRYINERNNSNPSPAQVRLTDFEQRSNNNSMKEKHLFNKWYWNNWIS